MCVRTVYGLLCLCFVLLIAQAATNAPTSDESGHLIAGVATVRTGDLGYYRVNPPLHRLVSGLAVDFTCGPTLSGIYPASIMASGARHEFVFAEQVIAANADEYAWLFYVGRIIRLPFILLAAWCLVKLHVHCGQTASFIAASMWLSSPLVLGHGWAIMPDAFSGVAIVGLIVSTLVWLRTRIRYDFLMVGIAWGLAIGTKFTFCPIYLMWPVAIIVHQWLSGKFGCRNAAKLAACHVGHGLIALLIVIGLYGGADVGVSLSDHQFASQRMQSLTTSVGWLPSPFPQQFLIGIDEQQLDLERGHPTYFMGQWYPDGMWWYYLIGLLAKEQLAFMMGLLFVATGAWRMFVCDKGKMVEEPVKTRETGLLAPHRYQTSAEVQPIDENALNTRATLPGRVNSQEAIETKACFVFCFIIAGIVLFILSAHSRMALNVRYAFPALPPLYIAIGIGITTTLKNHPVWLKRILISMTLIAACEMATTFPHYFAYINPLFGGSYSVPLVLHDSNFDGSQDLWRLEKWLEQNPADKGTERYTCVHSHVPDSVFKFVPNPPTHEQLQQVIAQRRKGKGTHKGDDKGRTAESESGEHVDHVEIIVMRGLGAPAPWTTLSGNADPMTALLLKELLQLQPDEFITPTLAIYRGHVAD